MTPKPSENKITTNNIYLRIVYIAIGFIALVAAAHTVIAKKLSTQPGGIELAAGVAIGVSLYWLIFVWVSNRLTATYPKIKELLMGFTWVVVFVVFAWLWVAPPTSLTASLLSITLYLMASSCGFIALWVNLQSK